MTARWPCLSALAAIASTTISVAQISTPCLFTDAQASNRVLTVRWTPAAGAGWELQSAESLSGPWRTEPVPAPGGDSASLLVAVPELYLRMRFPGDSALYSANAVAYRAAPLASPRSWVANPLDNGRGNRLSQLLPDLPKGTLAYLFDGRRQRWKTVSERRDDGWVPDAEWPPTEGAVLEHPSLSGTIEWTGLIAGPPTPLTLRGGWNLIGWPLRQSAATPGGRFVPQEGDSVVFPARSFYDVYFFEQGQWFPLEPTFTAGEACWYLRAAPNPDALPLQAAVYFNNRVAGAVDAPFRDPSGIPLSGAGWLAQLFTGGGAEEPVPVGDPLPFRRGQGAGFVDVAGGALRWMPAAPPLEATLEVRYWEARAGATYEQAAAAGGATGRSAPFTVNWPSNDGPPALPAVLTGLAPIGTPPPSPVIFEVAVDRVAKRLSFAVAGTPGRPVEVEQAAEIPSWQLWQTLPAPSTPAVCLETDLTAAAQFFRVR